MPVIDTDNIDVLRERVEAWRAVEAENQANYCEILRNLTFLVDEVNGHPSTSVRMLIEIRKILAELPGTIPMDRGMLELPRPYWLSPWRLIAIISGTSVLSSVLGIAICVVFHVIR